MRIYLDVVNPSESAAVGRIGLSCPVCLRPLGLIFLIVLGLIFLVAFTTLVEVFLCGKVRRNVLLRVISVDVLGVPVLDTVRGPIAWATIFLKKLWEPVP